MFNSGTRSDVLTEEKPQTVTTPPDELARDPNANRKLQFEGTVEVEGSFMARC